MLTTANYFSREFLCLDVVLYSIWEHVLSGRLDLYRKSTGAPAFLVPRSWLSFKLNSQVHTVYIKWSVFFLERDYLNFYFIIIYDSCEEGLIVYKMCLI